MTGGLYPHSDCNTVLLGVKEKQLQEQTIIR